MSRAKQHQSRVLHRKPVQSPSSGNVGPLDDVGLIGISNPKKINFGEKG